MKVVMLSWYTGPKGVPTLQPGDIYDFEDAEARRIVAVGGARDLNPDEVAANTVADEAANKAAGK